MLEDIDFRKVRETAMAVVREKLEGEEVWKAYLINTSSDTLRSVLISSKGYGEIDGQQVRTSELRQFIESIQPGEFVEIEEIREELLYLNNEFWVSFSKDNYMFDKKYVFLTETLKSDNFVQVPLIEKPGVLIK